MTSTPAVTGALDGQLPSIEVSGSGEALDPYDLSLNDLWAEAVVDHIETAETAIDVLENLGTKGYAQITANQAGITAEVDVTGLSVTWTAIPGRRYRTSIYFGIIGSSTGSFPNVKITDGAGTQKARWFTSTHVGGTGQTGVASVIETGLSGSTTRKVRAALTGAGSLTVEAAATLPAYILVEDIGT